MPIWSSKKVKDPVCGMDIDEKKAVATSTYKGKTYYFCAMGCKKSFDTNPEKYVGPGADKSTGHSGGCGCCQ